MSQVGEALQRHVLLEEAVTSELPAGTTFPKAARLQVSPNKMPIQTTGKVGSRNNKKECHRLKLQRGKKEEEEGAKGSSEDHPLNDSLRKKKKCAAQGSANCFVMCVHTRMRRGMERLKSRVCANTRCHLPPESRLLQKTTSASRTTTPPLNSVKKKFQEPKPTVPRTKPPFRSASCFKDLNGSHFEKGRKGKFGN
ncbi:hypothetical protein CDAR_238811 [Caerostris darwini]|uniref:Uncharacterized protein n=1 Tax=Caerostris darwini TaxID=1538125 RepID=A0AAV4PUD7_9ARAC|nr:hypothetical protein CDAR_238811 [Caerostris darwini]